MDDSLKNHLISLSNNLLTKLRNKSFKVSDKYDYYNADNTINDFGISTPKKMMNKRPGVGWASRGVNTLADRVVFDGFGDDKSGINDLFESINAFSILNKARGDAFIAGCAFIAVSGNGKLTPFTASEATGELDYQTGLLKYGLAVTDWGDYKSLRPKIQPKSYILFTQEFTATFVNRELVSLDENKTGRTQLHVLTRRSSADQPLGRSRITSTVRRIVQEVGRAKRRYEIASEFYSTPQRYILGLDQGADKNPEWDSQIGKVWAVTKDDDGDKPEVGQLGQMTISQFSGYMQDLARDFCAETGLTLRNLGYETSNPTSAESLSAMSDDLLLEAKHSQIEMGEQIKQVAITLRLTLDGNSEIPIALRGIKPVWQPIFQVSIGAAGDAVYKLLQVMPELAGTTQIYQMLGMSIRDAEKLKANSQQQKTNTFMGDNNGN